MNATEHNVLNEYTEKCAEKSKNITIMNQDTLLERRFNIYTTQIEKLKNKTTV